MTDFSFKKKKYDSLHEKGLWTTKAEYFDKWSLRLD